MERAKSQSKPSAGAPSSYLLAQRCLSYEHYLLARAQGAVEEPGLPQLVARTTASVVRGFFNRRTADRKNGGPRYPLDSESVFDCLRRWCLYIQNAPPSSRL